MVKFLLLCCGLMLGCGDVLLEPQGDIYVDSSFSSDELTSIERGINQWNMATDHAQLTMVVTDSPPVARSITPYPLPNPETVGRTYTTWIHQPWILLDIAALQEESTYKKYLLALEETVTHELGHALGLDHEGEGLMSAIDFRYTSCIDLDALNHYCSMYDCGPQAAPTCDK